MIILKIVIYLFVEIGNSADLKIRFVTMENFPDCILMFNERRDSSVTVIGDFAYIEPNFLCSLMNRSRVTLRRRIREGNHPYLEFFGGLGYRFDLNCNLDPDPLFLLVKNQIKRKINAENYILLG